MNDFVRLGEMVTLRKGRKAAQVYDHPVTGSKSYIQIDEVRGVPPNKFAHDPKGTEVIQDDLCIVWDGANAGTVGYGIEGLIGSTVARMRFVDPTAWSARFVGRLLQSRFSELNEQAWARGATIPHVDKGKLESIPLPRISKDDQTRLAVLMDKADDIRRKRKRELAFAEEFLKSSYVHIVGHLNADHANWRPFSIEQLADARKGSIRTGPFGSALRHGEFTDEGIAVLGIDNAVQNKFAWGERRFITREKYEGLRRFRVFPNDVIITIMGTTGRSAVVPEDIPEAITTKHLATITCNTALMHPEVLSFAIHSDPIITRQITARNRGAIMDGLNLGTIRSLEINLPPREEQERFVRILRTVRRVESQLNDPVINGSNLFQSLSQRAFRGDL